MFLDSNKKLVAVLTTAKTTLNMPVTIDAVDLTTTTTTPLPFQTYTNGVTPVDILSAPAASTIRKVNGLSIYGRDTAAKIIRVYGIDSTPTTGLITAGSFVAGNDYQIVSVGTTDFTLIGASANTVGVIFTATGVGTGTGTAATAYQHVDLQLQIDDTLCYTDAQGWYAVDSQGNLKSVQAASATSIATAIHGTTDKATPVGADELGIWDSITGLLNKVSFTNLWAQVNGGYPSIASAATIDVFGAAGTVVGVSGTTTVTALTAAPRAGVRKTVIPSDAAGFSITASANLIVDGATSGTYLMPKDANLEFISTSTTTFKVTTIEAIGTWTPTLTFGGGSIGMTGTFTGTITKIGRVKYASFDITLTSKGSSTGAALIGGIPIAPTTASANSIIDPVSGMSGLTSGGAIYALCSGASIYPLVQSATSRVQLQDTNFTNSSIISGIVIFI